MGVDGADISIPLPKAYPVDAEKCNWDMKETGHVGYDAVNVWKKPWRQSGERGMQALTCIKRATVARNGALSRRADEVQVTARLI